MAPRFRNCVFTWNNFPEDHEEQLRELPLGYIVYQEELGANGTPHLQGYFELTSQMTKSKVQKFIRGWHVEKRQGTQAQAIAYCTKEDTRAGDMVTWGERANQGKRTDIEGMYAYIREGKRERDIAEEMPCVHAKYFKAHDRYRSLVDYDSTREFRELSVHVLWGPAGTGKTRKAVESSGEDCYILNAPGNNGMLWWDGYQGEKTLIIDDFYGWVKYSTLLRILDGYQQRLQIKGGFTYAKWVSIYITSNKQLADWYPSIGDLAALRRRITEITKVE